MIESKANRKALRVAAAALSVSVAFVFAAEAPDPYRWLEDAKSPRVQQWIDDHNKRTEAHLAAIPNQQKIAARLREIYYADTFSVPQPAGDAFFFKKTIAGRNTPLFCWRRKGDDVIDHIWLDPGTFKQGNNPVVGDWVPSPDGKWVAFAVRPEGADAATLHVRQVDTGFESSQDILPGADFADVSWTPESKGFYYMRVPADTAIPPADRVAYGDIRYHQLGEDPLKDKAVYPPTRNASEYLSPKVSEDGTWLFVSVERGWTSNDIYAANRRSPVMSYTPLFTSTAAVAQVDEWGGYFYLLTSSGAPHGKILRKMPKDQAWTEVVTERSDTVIESMRIVGGQLVLDLLKNGSNAVEIRHPDGSLAWGPALPGQGSIEAISGRAATDDLFIEYESFFIPPRIYHARLKAKQLEIWRETQIPLDPNRFTADVVWYASKDGTKISMMIIQPRQFSRNGQAAVLLEGYGGFGTPMLPRFSGMALAWLEMGGLFAVPHLRGGGEYGEDWHRAGMQRNKQNTFDDMIAAAEFLIREGYTNNAHLAIEGISNGGLTAAATITQRPDLFQAAVIKNPLTDMIRYSLFGEGKAWIPEYGAPDDPEDYRVLYSYSPYHHIQKGVRYPCVLVLSAEFDDRVDPMHARKFAAALENASTSGRPILFGLVKAAGHSGSGRIAAQLKDVLDRLAFLKAHILRR